MSKNLTKKTKVVTKPENRFYVYCHYRNDTGKPFYVGKGAHHTGAAASNETFYQRAYSHFGRTKLWNRTVKKHGHTVEIILDNLTHEEVKAKEVEFISLYGRKRHGGLLVNFKRGGSDDATGYKHSDEYKAKIRAKRKPLEYFIEKYVAYEPMSGCWIWMGGFSDGFPKVYLNDQSLQAGRAIYQHEKGIKLKLKKELLFYHCGNKHCVNPNHAIVSTKPNSYEKQVKKLRKEDIQPIRDLAKSGVPHTIIADKYGVTKSGIEGILSGKSWSWVGTPEIIASDYHAKKFKEVVCIDTGRVFINARQAGSVMFNDPTLNKDIKRACTKRGRTKKFRGFEFEYTSRV